MGAVYQLLGYPGTGKYTIAKEIVRLLTERGEEAVLLDNHATANIVWSMVPTDRRFAPDVLDQLKLVRRAVLEAAEAIASPATSFVFTNFIPPTATGEIVDSHRDFALRRGQRLVVAALSCDREEILRRVPSPGRAERMKLVDVGVAARQMEAGMKLPDWPELTELPIDGLTATEAADAILRL